MADCNDNYPGQTAKPHELLELANEYASAAERLLELRRKGERLSQAPFRLTAIHAIELYLNAVLLAHGRNPAEVRGFQHDLSKRTVSAKDAGLILRRKTIAHIDALTTWREYLATRYDPQQNTTLSQLNRLHATLQEVRAKVLAIVERGESSGPTRKSQSGNQ